MKEFIAQEGQQKSKIPSWIIGMQCIAFLLLYATRMLPEIVGFRNASLVVDAIMVAITLWPLLANFFVWCTTEVSATATFATLIFWVCFGADLLLVNSQCKASELLVSDAKCSQYSGGKHL